MAIKCVLPLIWNCCCKILYSICCFFYWLLLLWFAANFLFLYSLLSGLVVVVPTLRTNGTPKQHFSPFCVGSDGETRNWNPDYFLRGSDDCFLFDFQRSAALKVVRASQVLEKIPAVASVPLLSQVQARRPFSTSQRCEFGFSVMSFTSWPRRFETWVNDWPFSS